MVYIQNNAQNQIWLPINEWSSLSNPTYLFELQNSQGRDRVFFIPENITSSVSNQYAGKYLVFEFNTIISQPQNFVFSAGNPCNIYLINENQYWLYIWEQTSTTNLNPLQSYNKVFNELAFAFLPEDNVFYTGNTLNFADNVIYYSQPRPSGTPNPSPTITTTPTQTTTPTPTPTETTTPTPTPTETNTPTPTPTETNTPTPTPTITPSPTPPPLFWNNINTLWNNNTNLWNN
jgi:cell division septation protein DedD